MPVFRIIGAIMIVEGVVVAAATHIDGQPTTNHDDGINPVVVGLGTTVAFMGTCGVAFLVYFFVIRPRLNHARVEEVEDGSVVSEPIALTDLPPAAGPATVPAALLAPLPVVVPAATTSIYQSKNPEFSTHSLPDPRYLNKLTMALSSHPPSQSDLDAAKFGLTSAPNTSRPDIADQPTQPTSESSQVGQIQRPQGLRPGTRQVGSRRHGMVFDNNEGPFADCEATSEAENEQSTISKLTGSESEAVSEVVEQLRRRQMMPNPDILPPSTIREEEAPEISKTQTDELNSSTQSIAGDTVISGTEDDQTIVSATHEHGPSEDQDAGQDNDNTSDADVVQDEDNVQHDNNAHDERADTGGQGTVTDPASEVGAQESRDHRRFSWSDEAYDPRDPRYDVEGTIMAINKNRNGNLEQLAQKTAGQAGGTAGPQQPTVRDDKQYEGMEKVSTNIALVPESLLLVRKDHSVHETSSPAAPIVPATTATGTTAKKPAGSTSASSDFDDLPDEQNIMTGRPRSFVIHGWPPEDAAPELRNILWQYAPSPEVIERARQDRERAEWEEKAKTLVVEKAKKTGEKLEAEEIARRVRQMYERSSQFRLEPTVYEQPPPSVAESSKTASGRVRALRDSLLPSKLVRNDTVRQEATSLSTTRGTNLPGRQGQLNITSNQTAATPGNRDRSVHQEAARTSITQTAAPTAGGLSQAASQDHRSARLGPFAPSPAIYPPRSSSLYHQAGQDERSVNTGPIIVGASQRPNTRNSGLFVGSSHGPQPIRLEPSLRCTHRISHASSHNSATNEENRSASTASQIPRPMGSLYMAANRDDNVRLEPAFASSQVLPQAATLTSITAQDGSRRDSPPPSPQTPFPSPRRNSRIPRSHQEPDLSHYL